MGGRDGWEEWEGRQQYEKQYREEQMQQMEEEREEEGEGPQKQRNEQRRKRRRATERLFFPSCQGPWGRGVDWCWHGTMGLTAKKGKSHGWTYSSVWARPHALGLGHETHC